jgi:hypothetical protein
LISDGARNFNDVFNREFYTNTNPRTRHIRHIRLQGDHNNNKMEPLNGEVRDRMKVMTLHLHMPFDLVLAVLLTWL